MYIKKIKKPELILTNNRKLLSKMYNLWARNLWIEDIIFYSLIINFSHFFFNKTINDKVQVCDVQKFSESFLKMLGEINLIETIHGSFEENEDGVLFLHCVLGFRSHFNIVSCIFIQLKNLLTKHYYSDFKLCYLFRFKNLVKLLSYISKDIDAKKKIPYVFFAVYSKFFLSIHMEFLIPLIHELKFVRSTTINIYGECYWHYDCNPSLAPTFRLSSGKLHDIGPISKRLQKKNFYKILYFLDFYFQKQDVIIYKKNLYIYNKTEGWPNKMLDILKKYLNEQIIYILTEIKKIFDFINIRNLYFLFKKYSKVVITKLFFLIKNKK